MGRKKAAWRTEKASQALKKKRKHDNSIAGCKDDGKNVEASPKFEDIGKECLETMDCVLLSCQRIMYLAHGSLLYPFGGRTTICVFQFLFVAGLLSKIVPSNIESGRVSNPLNSNHAITVPNEQRKTAGQEHAVGGCDKGVIRTQCFWTKQIIYHVYH